MYGITKIYLVSTAISISFIGKPHQDPGILVIELFKHVKIIMFYTDGSVESINDKIM